MWLFMFFTHKYPVPFKKILHVHFEDEQRLPNIIILVKIQDFPISVENQFKFPSVTI